MKIEIGKTYANRRGDKVQNIQKNDKPSVFGFVGTVYGSKRAYREDGSWALMSSAESGDDLVAEWREPVRIEHGKRYVRYDGGVTDAAVVNEGSVVALFKEMPGFVFVETGAGNCSTAESLNSAPNLRLSTDIAAEYVFRVEVGKFYRTAEGKIEGPMKLSRAKDCYISEKPNTMQSVCVGKGDAQIWNRDGSVCVPCRGEEMHHLVEEVSAPETAKIEEVAKPKGVLVEVGKFYMTKGGVVVGPMVEEGYRNWLQCGKGSIRQHVCPSAAQVWLPNGQVAEKADEGEDDHEITHEVHAPAAVPQSDEGFVSEIERLKSIISGLRGKLDRVQNIHAHTIKTVRKARRDIKKINKALSDEQQRRTSLERRLGEVVRAATEAAEYAKAIHKTAPKKVKEAESKVVDEVDTGTTTVTNVVALIALAEGSTEQTHIDAAFAWATTPQKFHYWLNRYSRGEPITDIDRAFFKALLDKVTSK